MDRDQRASESDAVEEQIDMEGSALPRLKSPPPPWRSERVKWNSFRDTLVWIGMDPRRQPSPAALCRLAASDAPLHAQQTKAHRSTSQHCALRQIAGQMSPHSFRFPGPTRLLFPFHPSHRSPPSTLTSRWPRRTKIRAASHPSLAVSTLHRSLLINRQIWAQPSHNIPSIWHPAASSFTGTASAVRACDIIASTSHRQNLHRARASAPLSNLNLDALQAVGPVSIPCTHLSLHACSTTDISILCSSRHALICRNRDAPPSSSPGPAFRLAALLHPLPFLGSVEPSSYSPKLSSVAPSLDRRPPKPASALAPRASLHLGHICLVSVGSAKLPVVQQHPNSRDHRRYRTKRQSRSIFSKASHASLYL
ncbi:uncharacterized protein PAN0_001c0555 [Moesziomyces antarcticus]|uniref:uncharacterized protein n=1 Tax=Pseudozyma antarctica TaxID=84753 RepID=UPI000719760E|nr:uncharacterized protein PAN0_001c0555 [Moesziomyces antarcticus]GAK62355.1 hypothetical protein PAN0_001c0555 [Moesziomyces antarcticus]